MRKLTLLVVVMAMALSASAQRFSWGVRAGMNVSDVHVKEDGKKQPEMESFSAKTGFNAGIMVDYAISRSFSVESGLYYSLLGAQRSISLKGEAIDYSSDNTINLSYLQIPILAKYSLPLSAKTKWSIGAGPYLGYGIGGKAKLEKTDFGEKSSEEWDSFSKETGTKRFDFGVAAATGVTFGKIYVGVKYDLGLLNTTKTSELPDGIKTESKNSNFSINVGYNF